MVGDTSKSFVVASKSIDAGCGKQEHSPFCRRVATLDVLIQITQLIGSALFPIWRFHTSGNLETDRLAKKRITAVGKRV